MSCLCGVRGRWQDWRKRSQKRLEETSGDYRYVHILIWEMMSYMSTHVETCQLDTMYMQLTVCQLHFTEAVKNIVDTQSCT